MLQRYAHLYKTLFRLLDILIISCCWVSLYFFWFQRSFSHKHEGAPLLSEHVALLLPVIAAYALVFTVFNLYEPKRTAGLLSELIDILKASFISIGVVSLAFYFVKEYRYSGLALFTFWTLTVIAIFIFRIFLRKSLRILRGKGYNLRHILIVGTGKLAKEVARRIRQHQEFGLEIIGLLSKEPEGKGASMDGIKIIGTYKDIKSTLSAAKVDQVIFALPQNEYRFLFALLGHIHDTMVSIRVVPDIRHNFFTLCLGAENLGGIPVLRLRDNLLHGYKRILKQAFDFLISLVALIALAPVMAVIAIAIKIESSGPVFYRQERMGLDGKIFPMIKFRSMRVNAETATGPVWAMADDSRRTGVGKILRRTSLDELPQLINVLTGEMSLVGPRPERPVFIEQFRKKIPSYILRHKMKAGITGWAQIHGLRGNSSLEQRIDYDIFYIENWSLWLDIKIFLLTIPAVIRGKDAY